MGEVPPPPSYLPPVGLRSARTVPVRSEEERLNWRARKTTRGVAPQLSLPPWGWDLRGVSPAPSYFPPATGPRIPEHGERIVRFKAGIAFLPPRNAAGVATSARVETPTDRVAGTWKRGKGNQAGKHGRKHA